MNRRQSLAPFYQIVLDAFEGQEGRVVVAFIDLLASIADERDDAVGRAISIDGYEWQADS
jgi:hypothetical protein